MRGPDLATGVSVTPPADYDPLGAGTNEDVAPSFAWVAASRFRLDMLNNRPLCGAGDPELLVTSAGEVRIHFPIVDPDAICILMLAPVSFEFELPESASSRPLTITVTYEGGPQVDTATLH
ncbi:hypothetical protein [Pseudoclavibacter sp. VKM Ac-2888]|uniref:hypothetical protein n=1 Tax=Pseudoclavibacter sp. VKM Ac-2888 TaxID=2783830 RepID=UPI00188AFBF0|nr:hypothetical protein [Pseudoclavibacter sp. VKM Ac-2888]MBF4549887.1 hypothetical protein [Pseudoclavibacter sp. VKM Ac-2888]